VRRRIIDHSRVGGIRVGGMRFRMGKVNSRQLDTWPCEADSREYLHSRRECDTTLLCQPLLENQNRRSLSAADRCPPPHCTPESALGPINDRHSETRERREDSGVNRVLRLGKPLSLTAGFIERR